MNLDNILPIQTDIPHNNSSNQTVSSSSSSVQISCSVQDPTKSSMSSQHYSLTEREELTLFELCLGLADEYDGSAKWWDDLTAEFQKEIRRPFKDCRKRIELDVKRRKAYLARLSDNALPETSELDHLMEIWFEFLDERERDFEKDPVGAQKRFEEIQEQDRFLRRHFAEEAERLRKQKGDEGHRIADGNVEETSLLAEGRRNKGQRD